MLFKEFFSPHHRPSLDIFGKPAGISGTPLVCNLLFGKICLQKHDWEDIFRCLYMGYGRKILMNFVKNINEQIFFTFEIFHVFLYDSLTRCLFSFKHLSDDNPQV